MIYLGFNHECLFYLWSSDFSQPNAITVRMDSMASLAITDAALYACCSLETCLAISLLKAKEVPAMKGAKEIIASAIFQPYSKLIIVAPINVANAEIIDPILFPMPSRMWPISL